MDGFDPVSVELEVNKHTMRDMYGDSTDASSQEDQAYYAFKLTQQNFGKELELAQK